MEMEKLPVLGLEAKLTPVRTASGLAPAPAIYEEIYEMENALAALYAPHAFSLRAFLGRIQIFCRAETAEEIQAIVKKTPALLRLIKEKNEKLRAGNATFYFRCAIAEDFQRTPLRRVPPLSISPEPWLFTGTLPERLDKIAEHMPAALPVPVLITRALYEKLPETDRELLQTCYYIMHICCYGE